MEQHFSLFVSIVGSINELICLLMDKHVFFWKPTTRILKKLPHSGIKLGIGYSIVYGFGYDESTDDYRLVGIFRTFGNEYLEIVMVYSLRADCWRRIGSFPSDESITESGKFVNGAIHWLAHSTQNSGSNLPYSKSIVSLNLAKETYGEVSQPSYAEGEYDLSLDVSRDCLFVLCDYPGSHADFWMMKEYGVRESWTKLSRIPYDDPDDPDPDAFLWSLHISKNVEILLQMGTRIVLYDPKSNSLRIPDIHNFDACVDSTIYIESLVSPLIE